MTTRETECISRMKVPAADSSLYLIMQQMDLLKKGEDGHEYAVCQFSRDADGDGWIQDEEQLRADTEEQTGTCVKNQDYDIEGYYFSRNLDHFKKEDIAKVAEALKREAVIDIASGKYYIDFPNYSLWRPVNNLVKIGKFYPDLIEDFVPQLGALLYDRQGFELEDVIETFGVLGSVDPFLVEDYIPSLRDLRDGLAANVGPNTARNACITLNIINQCGDELRNCDQELDFAGCGMDIFADNSSEGLPLDKCYAGAHFGWMYTGEIDGTDSAEACIQQIKAETGVELGMTCQTFEDCGPDPMHCHSNKTICRVM